MMFLKVENEQNKLENKNETLSLSGCFNKEWLSLTNKPQKLSMLICCVCNQIVNNAMELHCDEHENAEHVYLVGGECLEKYLEQNNGKCPIEQHSNCRSLQNKIVRKFVSELLVICPRQFELKKRGLNEEIKSEEKKHGNELDLKSDCDYEGKIKELKDDLDKSCNLIFKQTNYSI
ncbi:hypothetical protein RFI_36710 [Reticulomyxa filosa]|uniref:Uncharacterized protein n=1 Tax=Reticulomyxa filosa TaxID=46433 RepID=X6LGL5_RETFI|nr:hypothetical protein RFI_36710 [Reticulomyxa filosa]|eukprot:ETO00729.1 hypothetical protein RFI_36710 [Reticulomyxa filosa]